MQGILDYNYANTQRDARKGKKRYPEIVKNQSSVGNPILTDNSEHASNMKDTRNQVQSERSDRNAMKTTGNMHLNRVESRSRFTLRRGS